MPVTIFFCYAREDEALLNKLKTHLRPLQRQGLIDVWHDREISAGSEWEQEIKQHLNTAQIILLLVSPDFMDSDYCYGIEMQRALERHACGEARVIPIILHPVYWYGEPLGKLQALPTDGKPVTSSEWQNVNSALFDVTQGLLKVVMQLTPPPAVVPAVVETPPQHVAQARSISPLVPQARKTTPFRAPLAIEKLTVLRTLSGHTGNVRCVVLSADGATLVSGSYDNTIKVWNMVTGKVVQTLSGHKGTVHSVALSVDGTTLISCSEDHPIKVWNMITGKEIRLLSGHTKGVGSIALSTDEATLVSGSGDKTIKVWNMTTGKEIRTLTGHTDAVYSVALSVDGTTLVSCSNDRTIKVWSMATGKEVQTLTGHTGFVKSVVLSADGATLVSGSGDKTIKVWSMATGKEVQTLTGHTGVVYSVALSADGTTIVSGSYDNTIKVWGI